MRFGTTQIAVSANYVDGSNFQRHLQELRWQAIAESQQDQSRGGGHSQQRELRKDDDDGGEAGGGRVQDGGRTAALLRAFEADGFDHSMQMDMASDAPWEEFKRMRK
eukprot:COSAG06_NODE_324_length_17552_cov_11.946370_6_plen_107_part_00